MKMQQLQRIKEIFDNLLDEYESAQSTVIWEYGGSIPELISELAALRAEFNELLDNVDGRLSGQGKSKRVVDVRVKAEDTAVTPFDRT